MVFNYYLKVNHVPNLLLDFFGKLTLSPIRYKINFPVLFFPQSNIYKSHGMYEYLKDSNEKMVIKVSLVFLFKLFLI